MAVTKTKKRSSNEDIPMSITELASKVLTLPTTAKTRQPSKRLQQVIGKIGSIFMTLEDSINEALELGRKEGFKDIEIGDMIREEFKRLGRPRMTLSRYLPATAKHLEKARPKPKSDFGNKVLPNAITTTTTKKKYFEERKSKWESLPKPENPGAMFIVDRWGIYDFEIEKLNSYPLAYCRKVIMYMDECFRLHEKHTWEWDRAQQKTVSENKELRKENEVLKAAARPVAEIDQENQRLNAEIRRLRTALEERNKKLGV